MQAWSLATKPNNLNSIPGTHTMEREQRLDKPLTMHYSQHF